MKKIFLFVLMLFAFVACSSTQFIHDAKPITKDEKTVLIQYFPTDFEIDLEKTLENNFWKVSVVSNKDTSSPSLKSNFAITCEGIGPDYLGTHQGVIKFSDLRTGKRIAVYKFKVATIKDTKAKIFNFRGDSETEDAHDGSAFILSWVSML